MSKLSVVGRVSKLFGLDGGLAINLYDTFPADANFEEPLFVNIDGLAVPLFIEKFERRGKSGALVTFADIDNSIRATELLGMELLTRNAPAAAVEKADDGEIFLEDLAGFRAVLCELRSDGSRTEPIEGRITAYIDSEMNPLFAIDASGTEILIPASEDFIESLDIDAREIELTLPEGLLELYL